jgi:hypothetical protein
MRKIMLAAILAVLGMASQSAAARDHGFGFRHFSGHAGPKLHLRHHGFKFHHGGFVGKPRAIKSRHFGRFDHRGSAFRVRACPTAPAAALRPERSGAQVRQRRFRAQVRPYAAFQASSLRSQARSSRSVLRVRPATAVQAVARTQLCLRRSAWPSCPPPEHAGCTGRPRWRAARRRTARSPTQTAGGDRLSTCPRASARPGSLKLELGRRGARLRMARGSTRRQWAASRPGSPSLAVDRASRRGSLERSSGGYFLHGEGGRRPVPAAPPSCRWPRKDVPGHRSTGHRLPPRAGAPFGVARA